jgi:hypothetical protein
LGLSEALLRRVEFCSDGIGGALRDREPMLYRAQRDTQLTAGGFGPGRPPGAGQLVDQQLRCNRLLPLDGGGLLAALGRHGREVVTCSVDGGGQPVGLALRGAAFGMRLAKNLSRWRQRSAALTLRRLRLLLSRAPPRRRQQ